MSENEDKLRAALRKLSRAAKRFQLETDEKKRDGRIWDRLYEAIEQADDALRRFPAQGETPVLCGGCQRPAKYGTFLLHEDGTWACGETVPIVKPATPPAPKREVPRMLGPVVCTHCGMTSRVGFGSSLLNFDREGYFHWTETNHKCGPVVPVGAEG